MNEFFVFYLTVSIFAFNAFCMNPSSFKPPPPANVEFGECFFVPKITSTALSAAGHNYRHICREKFPDTRPQLPEHEKNWYFIGKYYKGSALPSRNQSRLIYVPVKQSLIRFVFLKETNVEFASKSTNDRFRIIFQSFQQRNAFYKIIYEDVDLSEAAPNKIRGLYELIRIQDQEDRKIGNNLDALKENINYNWYVTFKNDQGEPLLIFCQTEAAVIPTTLSGDVKPRLLLRVNATYYTLSFSSSAEANNFSSALRDHVKVLRYGLVPADIVPRFENAQIAIDSQDV